MKKETVILIPVYNLENYISENLNSILNQTYNDFDLILVNDGSTDKTLEVIETFKKSFQEKSIGFTVFNKENGGAASAVNVGLKHIKGYKYVLIMDGDDCLTPDSLKIRVEFLNNNPEYLAAYGYVNMIDENSRAILSVHKSDGIVEDKLKTFWNIFYKKGIVFSAYLFRVEELLKLLKDGQIYESHGGQNFQLLLPIAYNGKIKVLNDVILNCLIRGNSHSRSFNSIEKNYKHGCDLHDILVHTLQDMKLEKEYFKQLETIRLENELSYNYAIGNRKNYKKNYKELKNLKVKIPSVFKIKYVILNLKLNKIIDKVRGK